MRYTIHGLQQDKLIEEGLDPADALLIDTVSKMYSTSGFEFIIEDGNKYMWLNQSYLIEYLPIIGNKRALQRRLKKLEDKGIIKRTVKHSKGGVKGTFSYLAFTEKHRGLTEFEGYDKSDVGGTSKVSQGVRQDRRNKDTPYIDTLNRDTTTGVGGGSDTERDKELTAKVKRLYQNSGFGFLNIDTDNMLNNLIEEYTSEWVVDAMEIGMENNVRRMNYVRSILQRWKVEGKSDNLKGENEKPKLTEEEIKKRELIRQQVGERETPW